MAYVLGDIPFFDCMVRAEYTRNHVDRHGEFYPAVAHAVRCVRGQSLWFQTILTEKHAGAAFMVPIEALVWKPCEMPADMTYVQPWDVFSSDFGVCQMSFVSRGATYILPERIEAQYRFTLDFTGSDLADHVEQHKSLHLNFLSNGLIGAFPNNRVLWRDDAFYRVAKDKPDFTSLAGEYRAEGHQHIFRKRDADIARITDQIVHEWRSSI